MTGLLTVRKRPCPSCPYRRDVPSGIWHESEYAKLPQFDGPTQDQLAAGAFALFHCHSQPGGVTPLGLLEQFSLPTLPPPLRLSV